MLAVRRAPSVLCKLTLGLGLSTAVLAADVPTTCDYFECAFLAFETAVTPQSTVNDAPYQMEAQRRGQLLFEKGVTKGLEWLALPMEDLPIEERPLVGWSCMILTDGLETAEHMFALGRAYEFSSRRMMSLHRDTSLSSSEAFNRLNCNALISD